ncbi:hypothetical protein AMK06_CH01130 [Rhizobium sp. N541]|nr:hypothetical protein AMK05_CH01171 [Rhizobium sp. N324]ANM16064.1 hypothetical protein AMK06_CH01130 [Rhizobium sp. N541]ANM22450.1 hypothetical protein AMK07_CH01128 [Rhizobium sp. N941]OYD03164.1 hypothetical protein AMK08_CH101166 [Rhizobium sp. N4311]
MNSSFQHPLVETAWILGSSPKRTEGEVSSGKLSDVRRSASITPYIAQQQPNSQGASADITSLCKPSKSG